MGEPAQGWGAAQGPPGPPGGGQPAQPWNQPPARPIRGRKVWIGLLIGSVAVVLAIAGSVISTSSAEIVRTVGPCLKHRIGRNPRRRVMAATRWPWIRGVCHRSNTGVRKCYINTNCTARQVTTIAAL